MRPKIRRTNGRQAPIGDGLNEEIWGLLREYIAIAARGDAVAARSLIPRLERELPNDGQAATYISYCLEYRVIEIMERRPTPEDLHELAISTWPRLEELIQGDDRILEDLLRGVFTFPPLRDKNTGARLIVLGSAALAVLLNDPAADIDAIRPHLAEWWRRNLEDFRRRGIVGAEGS